MVRELICIVCPRGCHLKVDSDNLKVSGNGCIRGEKYGVSEVTNPVRTVTSTMKVDNGELKLIPVKTVFKFIVLHQKVKDCEFKRI